MAPTVLALLLVGLTGGSLAGCGRNEFPDRTARVRVGPRLTTFQLESCGLDGATVFVVGRSAGGAVLQAVVGVADDRRTGVLGSTGLTVVDGPDEGAGAVAAFGAEAWGRRGEAGREPGRIASARVRGSRIQVSGDVEPVDGDDRPPASSTAETAATEPFSLDARCDRLD